MASCFFVSRKPLVRREVPKKPRGDDKKRKTLFAIIKARSAGCTNKQREEIRMNDANSLLQPSGIVNTILYLRQKCRRKVFYGGNSEK
jgi:hypothetical protein